MSRYCFSYPPACYPFCCDLIVCQPIYSVHEPVFSKRNGHARETFNRACAWRVASIAVAALSHYCVLRLRRSFAMVRKSSKQRPPPGTLQVRVMPLPRVLAFKCPLSQPPPPQSSTSRQQAHNCTEAPAWKAGMRAGELWTNTSKRAFELSLACQTIHQACKQGRCARQATHTTAAVLRPPRTCTANSTRHACLAARTVACYTAQ